MIIGFDPVGKSVDLDFQDGSPQVTFYADNLIVKYYLDPGILFADMRGEDLEVGLIENYGDRGKIRLTSIGDRNWIVKLQSL